MKQCKRILAMVLTMVMLAVGLPMAVSAKEYKVGDIIQFGSYPQSEVKDEELIAKLEAAEGAWKSYGYMSGAGTERYDGSAQPSDYMKYRDVTVDGERYRAVTFSTYRKEFTNYKSDYSTSDSCQAENGYYINNIYWFKFEPICWRVLDPQTGLVLCEDIIDSQPYSNTVYELNGGWYYKDPEGNIYANNYAESSIRAWLNDDFYYTAFSTAEQSSIAKTTIENKAESYLYDSETTNDKIFMLSPEDSVKTDYGFSSEAFNIYTSNRKAAGSDYAKCQGLYVPNNRYIDNKPSYNFKTEDGRNASLWWLRKAGRFPEKAYYIYGNGELDNGNYNFYNVFETCIGVRPAFCFKNEIINEENPYNLGDETYYFENYSDEDSEVGHCFGMSMTSSAYYLGLLDYPYPVEKTYLLYEDNPLVKEPICYYHARQGSYANKSIVAGGSGIDEIKDLNTNSDWNEVLNYVKNHDYDGKGNLVIAYHAVLTYFDEKEKNYKTEFFGHAVNFLRYEEVDGEERIYAYDNNFPDDETYFYKDSEGKIQQEPKKTFERPVISMFLLSVPIYFSIVGNYDKSRFIYTNKGSMEVEGVAPFTMFADSTSCQQILFELPDDITEVTIKPLKDNAEFRYMDQVYTFSDVDENTVGILKLAESDDEEAVQQIEFTIEGAPEKPTEPSTDPTTPDTPTKCTCKCHSSGFKLFIWKIGNFFHRIFRMDKYRECPCKKKMHW